MAKLDNLVQVAILIECDKIEYTDTTVDFLSV